MAVLNKGEFAMNIKKNIIVSMTMIILTLCLQGTISSAVEGKQNLDYWDITKEYMMTNQNVTYHAYLSKDKKESWIFKADVAKDKKNVNVVIPDKIENAPVVMLGFISEFYNIYVPKLKIPGWDDKNMEEWEGYITFFGDIIEPWHGVTPQKVNVNKIIMPDSVETIGKAAFSYVSSLKYVYLSKQIKEININGIDKIPLNELLSALMLLGETVQDIANSIVEKESVTEEENRTSSNIFELGINILRVHNDLHQDIMRLVNDPILILEGDAGVGKSHLMADTVQRRQKENLFSLFFLGQKFVTDEEPFTQIMRMLSFSSSSEELLETLEAKAESTGHRIIIFIDAINEGHGLAIWQSNIRSFIDKIRQHPWLGLVLSIRTSYQPAILPWEEFGNDYCVWARHYGFGANTQKAVQLLRNMVYCILQFHSSIPNLKIHCFYICSVKE